MPAKTKAKDLGRVQGRVLAWYEDHGRRFPWRETRDPYRTLVAEFMLQQTQTGRVAPIYEEFVRRFPTLERLAHAPAMEVIRAWRGLGYNRRAVFLHEAAQAIAHHHGAVFPSDPATLRRLTGIAGYTASAIACFAFDAQVPVVDTNVRRVLARAALARDADEVPAAGVARLATQWLPAGDAYRWNQALMDVGAMICRPERPLCAQCPLKSACGFYAKGRHRSRRERPTAKAEPFEGSRRQARGGIVEQLRRAARTGLTLAKVARALHPDRAEKDLSWLGELLVGLERDGLVELSASARAGSPRGVVRLPTTARRRAASSPERRAVRAKTPAKKRAPRTATPRRRSRTGAREAPRARTSPGKR